MPDLARDSTLKPLMCSSSSFVDLKNRLQPMAVDGAGASHRCRGPLLPKLAPKCAGLCCILPIEDNDMQVCKNKVPWKIHLPRERNLHARAPEMKIEACSIGMSHF